MILFVRFYFHELKYSIDVEMYAQYVQCSTSWMLVLAGASLTYSDLGSDGAPTNYDFLPVAKLAKARDCNGKHKVILRSGVRLAPGRSFFCRSELFAYRICQFTGFVRPKGGA